MGERDFFLRSGAPTALKGNIILCEGESTRCLHPLVYLIYSVWSGDEIEKLTIEWYNVLAEEIDKPIFEDVKI